MTAKTWAASTLLVLTLLGSGAARAEIGPYIGASVGQSSIELDLRDVGAAGFRIDDEDFAFKVFFGVELPGPIAVEGGYRDLGQVSGDGAVVRLTGETDGFDAFLLGKLPIGPVSLFAKAGFIAWDSEARTETSADIRVPEFRATDDGTDFAWGVGVSAELGPVGVRGEFEKLEIEFLDDVTMLSVGVTYEF
jgi:hypothetical protein